MTERDSISAALDPRLTRIVAEHPYPLLFATISGAHLYGFPSPDSDFDLRGIHVLPLREVLHFGINATLAGDYQTHAPFTPTVMTLYDAWAGPATADAAR